MGPTWESDCGRVRLYLGDCLEVLPALGAGGVDAVVTDPPYGTQNDRDGYGRRQKWQGKQRILNDGDLTAFAGMLDRCRQPLAPGGWVVFFCSPKRRDDVGGVCRGAGLNVLGECVWDKKSPGLGGGIRYRHEAILLGSFGRPGGHSHLQSVLEGWVPKGQHGHRQQFHPHEKPVGVVRALVRYASRPGERVLDPFMGSGSHGIAAVCEGRCFTGIEYDPHYFDTARRRIEEALAEQQNSLFVVGWGGSK